MLRFLLFIKICQTTYLDFIMVKGVGQVKKSIFKKKAYNP